MTELRTIQVGKVLIHDITASEADARITSWLGTDGVNGGGDGRYVCTPNADYVVRAQRDPSFLSAINDADLRLPDGKWIVYASRIAGRPLRATVTGRLLIPRLAATCRDRGLTMGLMGAGPGVAAAAAAKLTKAQPGLKISHAISPPMGFVIGSAADEAIVTDISADAPAILCVALGAPKQELWMQAHKADLPDTVLVGIGAGLDIVAGRFRTAPAWMTRLGFEWLFRLAQEPRRLARRYLVDDPWILWWAIRTRLHLS
jgi:N-acetylglucosaminyldiphosphoundecaprenol N-acetyl-beta-D-mannosaminyltransferase